MPAEGIFLLDMDPGVDDALGILLALRTPDVHIAAITVLAGNVGLDRCAMNALKAALIARPDSPIPGVYRGADRPIQRPLRCVPNVHGSDGLGDVWRDYTDPPITAIGSQSATEVILEHAHVAAITGERLTIVATGPLTNIAQAIRHDPEAMRQVHRIVWMGGAYAQRGNITEAAEFNAYSDPHAAAIVMESGIAITAVGLEACRKCALMRDELDDWVASSPSPSLLFAQAICTKYMDFHANHEDLDGCYLYDPLAIGVALWPELITVSEEVEVEVITQPGPEEGRTRVCARHLDASPGNELSQTSSRVEVVIETDVESFLRRFYTCLR